MGPGLSLELSMQTLSGEGDSVMLYDILRVLEQSLKAKADAGLTLVT